MMEVSILIDTHNHGRIIERAITSVLEQDMPMDGVEILVVDDGSADRTPEIVRCFEPLIAGWIAGKKLRSFYSCT